MIAHKQSQRRLGEFERNPACQRRHSAPCSVDISLLFVKVSAVEEIKRQVWSSQLIAAGKMGVEQLSGSVLWFRVRRLRVGGRSAKWKHFSWAIKFTECGVISNRRERSFRSLVQLWLINCTTLNVASHQHFVLREALLRILILLGRCNFTSSLRWVQFLSDGL